MKGARASRPDLELRTKRLSGTPLKLQASRHRLARSMKALLKVLAEGIYRDPTHDWGLCLLGTLCGFRDGGRHEQPPTVEQQKPEGRRFGFRVS